MSQNESHEPAEQQRKSFFRKHAFFFAITAVLWILCAAWYIFQPTPATVEALYTRGLYRHIAAIITPVTERLPFSLALILVTGGPLLFLVLWAGNWIYRRRVKKLSHWRGLIWGPKWLLLIVPAVWLWFLLFWGMGYARMPVEERLRFDSANVSEDELLHIKEGLLAVILRDQPLTEDDRDTDRALASVSKAMQTLTGTWDGMSVRIPRRVKATPYGMLLMNGTSGVCAPFTLEPHVDGALPDTWFVSVGAHELGHIAGICDEGETNLISYIAGLRADDPFARYAVALNVLLSVAHQLKDDARKDIMKRLPEQAHRDLDRVRKVQDHYRIDWFQKWSWRAYNQYLKSQGVREGVRSYGRGTQLLAKAWRAGYIDLPNVTQPPSSQQEAGGESVAAPESAS